MSRCWKAALPFLLAAVIILAAASRPVVLHIGFPCDSYWNVPGENYYTFIDAAIEKFDNRLLYPLQPHCLIALNQKLGRIRNHIIIQSNKRRIIFLTLKRVIIHQRIPLRPSTHRILTFQNKINGFLQSRTESRIIFFHIHTK